MSDPNKKVRFGLFWPGKCWLGVVAEEAQKVKTKPKHAEGMWKVKRKNYCQKHLQYLSKVLNAIYATNSIEK